MKSSKRKVGEWFKELEHYGFIIKTQHGSLGVDGKGKSPKWRLTELGVASNASSRGETEIPTNDFLKWDGILFSRPTRKQNPGSDVWDTPRFLRRAGHQIPSYLPIFVGHP